MRIRIVLALGMAVLLSALLAGCGAGDWLAPDSSGDDPVGGSEQGGAAQPPSTGPDVKGPLTVTNTKDSGAGSLRNAVETANSNDGADTIEVITTGTVELESELPELTTDMGIVGPGENDFTVERGESAPEFRIFTVREATVSISGLTITEGFAAECEGSTDTTCGGGIENSGDLTVKDSTITGNTAETGGGISNAAGDLTVEGSTISENISEETRRGGGGGISNYRPEGTTIVKDSTISGNITDSSGGGVNNTDGTLTVKSSTISGNSAEDHGGGIDDIFGTLNVEGSTISDNTSAGRDGGGIYSYTFSRDETTVTNTTISGNSSGRYGGGVYNHGSRMVIEYSTIANNIARDGQGSGIGSSGNPDDTTETTTEVFSSIIAGNENSDMDTDDDVNSFVSEGYNLIGEGNATDAFDVTGDQVNVSDPGLDSLADNGGPTETHALREGSPAIDAASSDCPPPATDQRGEDRPQGEGCDIGSFDGAEPPSPDDDPPPADGGEDSGSGDDGGQGCLDDLSPIEAAQAGADATQGEGPCSAPEGGEDPNEDSGEVASLDQAVEDYYLAAGAEEWDYTYDHLDSQTQSMFTEEEWSRKNQWFWDRNPIIYHILSIEPSGDSEGSVAEVELRITGEDGSSSTRTTYFVLEDGEWKHRFSEEETDLFMPDVTFEEFVEAQGGTPSGGGEDSGESGVCAGVSDCEMVDSADVDGDGALDEVALVGEPEEHPTPRTQFTVRVLLADGTTLTREVETASWPHDTAWHGATDFGQVAGEELVIGGTSGAHTKWYQVLTYRDGELVQLPYPESDPARGDTFYAAMWPIDAAMSAYIGVQCDTDDSTVVLRSVTPKGDTSEDAAYEGEATSWVLDGGQWQMIDSRNLEYPDGESAYEEISGWQCGDLPQGYE